MIFRLLIEGITEHGFEGIGGALNVLGPVKYALIPALGGLIVGPLIYFGAREAKGHGVPEVMDSVARFGGRLRARVIAVKAVASAVTIGSGGSSGREGPIVHMGSAVGSNIAQKLKLSPAQTKILLGCGAAGGIAATFNTPIAGVLFAVELILMEFKTRSFVPLVISSVIATVVAPAIHGVLTGDITEDLWKSSPAFTVLEDSFKFVHPLELVAYLVLGFICALVALLYITMLYKAEDFFDNLKLKPWLKPALGGLILGGLGIVFVQVHGVGYDHIEQVLNGGWELTRVGVAVMAVLAFAKIIAVSLTLGSGGSGGIFAPSLFIGCMTGGAFGAIVHNLFPGSTGEASAYALVGMAALVAASTRGTLTAILIIFEMTRVYEIVLPLLFACVIADMVAALTSPDTIYTKKLSRRGINIVQDLEPNIMKMFNVGEVMVPVDDVDTVLVDDELHKLVAVIRRSGHNGFPVMDEDGQLVGVVTHEDIRTAQSEGKLFVRASDIMTSDLIKVIPEETGEEALRKMGDRRISHLPVVHPQDPNRLVGWLSKGDIVFAYDDYHRRMEAALSEGPAVSLAESTAVRAPRSLLGRLRGRGRGDDVPIEVSLPEEGGPEAEQASEVEDGGERSGGAGEG